MRELVWRKVARKYISHVNSQDWRIPLFGFSPLLFDKCCQPGLDWLSNSQSYPPCLSTWLNRIHWEVVDISDWWYWLSEIWDSWGIPGGNSKLFWVRGWIYSNKQTVEDKAPINLICHWEAIKNVWLRWVPGDWRAPAARIISMTMDPLLADATLWAVRNILQVQTFITAQCFER